ncbi:hypothetical protein CK209_16825 [Vibrio anguillarum]|nr:hypothetical protein CK209_16825 [Vibrio anguillarum]
MSIFTLKFVANSNRKTGKFLCLPQSVLVLVCCQFSVRKVWKEQVIRSFRTCCQSENMEFTVQFQLDLADKNSPCLTPN